MQRRVVRCTVGANLRFPRVAYWKGAKRVVGSASRIELRLVWFEWPCHFPEPKRGGGSVGAVFQSFQVTSCCQLAYRVDYVRQLGLQDIHDRREERVDIFVFALDSQLSILSVELDLQVKGKGTDSQLMKSTMNHDRHTVTLPEPCSGRGRFRQLTMSTRAADLSTTPQLHYLH